MQPGRRLALTAGVAVLAGCATQAPVTFPGAAPELAGVPFFPQDRYQCGPAALATVLADSGVAATPEELVPQVYVPERRGSLVPELKAATRHYGRLPYELAPGPGAIFEEVAAGRPVLVLQNLGLDWLAKWHYAVVVGFDAASESVVLRSGRRERKLMSWRRFLQTWQGESRWAMLALRPGELPAGGSPQRYVEAVVASEARLPADQVTSAYEAGLGRWPDDATLAFAAANHARGQERPETAAALYRHALSRQPLHVGALNNYADLLIEHRCLASAAAPMAAARATVEPASALYPVVMATSREFEAEAAGGQFDRGPACNALAGTAAPAGSGS